MNLTYADVQEILRIIDSSTIEELHLELGDFKLIVRKRVSSGPPGAEEPRSAVEAGPEAMLVETKAPLAAGQSAADSPAAEAAAERDARSAAPPPQRRQGVEVKSPMIGTFYRAPAPGARSFVDVGSVVEADDIVCIIEVMKLMNSIRAGCRGRVTEICAENGQLVEFGQALMVIEPR